MSGLEYGLNRYFKLEKRTVFSHHYVNRAHKKVDIMGRLISTTMIFLLFVYFFPQGNDLMLAIAYLLVFSIQIIFDGVRAYFEWYQSDQPKRAIVTLVRMGVWMIVLLSIGFVIYQRLKVA